VILAVHPKSVNLGSQDLPDQSRRAGKLNDRAARRYLCHLEALLREPIGDRLEVGIGRAELLTELLGGEPLVKPRRGFYLLVVEQLPQRGFLLRPALQDQEHALHGQVVRRHPLVKLRPRKGVDVPLESDKVIQVHRLRHTGAHGVGLCQ
jgi:hypothetical protein